MLVAWNCFMKIIVCVFVTLWEHVQSSNFSQVMSLVQLGESQTELGTRLHSRMNNIINY